MKIEPVREDHSPSFVSDVIAMAWADDISFDKIKNENGISESEVIKMMRSHLKPASFKIWRRRVSGRKSKHGKNEKAFAGEIRAFLK